MSKCDDWQNWDSLSPEEKEQFLNDLIADAADQFGIPTPDVNYGDAGGSMGEYDADTGEITIDPSAEGESGYAQFDDAAEVADTAFHETVHAAHDYYYGEDADTYGSEEEADDLSDDMVDELNDECDPPPYPGEGGGGNGDGGGGGDFPTTAEGWNEVIAEMEAIEDLPLEPIPLP